MSAEYEYLSPSFDPASLTVPKLRSILVEHEVSYPSSAKKPDLIALFNEQVIPKAKKILDKQARAKRSSRGIENIPSSQVSVATAEDEEQDLPAPLTSPTKRTSRRTTRGATAETEPAGSNSAVNGSATERRTSSRAMRSSEPLPELEPAPVRRGRKSAVTPSIKLEEQKEPEAWHRYDDTESPFSRENPFQSGSSPSGITTSPNRRRTTLGPVEHKETRKSTSRRRKTDFVRSTGQEEGAVVPARRTLELPVSRVKQEEEEEAGEEFTPDAQEELALEQLNTGREVMPARRTRRKGTPALFSVAPLVMGLAIFGGGFTVWRQEKVEVGYCGLGRETSTQLAGVDIPEWASTLQPQCEPCPPHAICRPNFEAICEPDFVLQPHPLSLGGLVPLPPSCEPDGEKQKKIKMVADRAIEELRERNAKYECGELVDEKGKQIRTPEIAEDQLKATISAQRRRGLSQEEFEDLWRAAIGEITNRDEVTSKADG